MSIGVGKGWRRWRNQATRAGKEAKLAEELKERFGQRSNAHSGNFIPRTVTPEPGWPPLPSPKKK